jgi:hypothetical protein
MLGIVYTGGALAELGERQIGTRTCAVTGVTGLSSSSACSSQDRTPAL